MIIKFECRSMPPRRPARPAAQRPAEVIASAKNFRQAWGPISYFRSSHKKLSAKSCVTSGLRLWQEATTATERVQRRLAAILAADVVGYSRLMSADEAGTLAELNVLRREVIDPKIAGHGGRLVKLMGDRALVEFASVVDAVECAV